jgi:hypothetical protein
MLLEVQVGEADLPGQQRSRRVVEVWSASRHACGCGTRAARSLDAESWWFLLPSRCSHQVVGNRPPAEPVRLHTSRLICTIGSQVLGYVSSSHL